MLPGLWMTDKLSQARAHHQAGRLGQAYDLYRAIIASEPDNLEALFHYGHVVRQSGQTEAARDIFLHAISLAPREALLYGSLGEIQKELGAHGEAVKAFEQAIRLNGDDYVSHINLGLVHMQQGRLNSAVTYLRMADVLKPDFAPGLVNLGTALYRLGEERDAPEPIEEAIGLLTRACELDPDNANAAANLGLAHFKRQAFAEARAACIRALDLAPGHPLARTTLASVQLATGDGEGARVSLQAIVAANPKDIGHWKKLGSLHYSESRYFEAIEAFRKVIALAPDDVRVHVLLGTMYNEVSQFEDAVAANRRAIELGADSASLHRAHAVALAQLGRTDEARAAMARAHELKPDDQGISFALAALSGDEIATAPAGYVKDLFDDFAAHFDDRLVSELDYRSPELLLAAFEKTADLGAGKLTIVDLGCGTGLCGELFKNRARRLVGSDLSDKMIDKAAARGIYDDLRCEGLDRTLAAFNGEVDVALAADVFVYVGDLAPVFVAARRALRDGGVFAFSTEMGDEAAFSVGASFRFSHADSYIRTLAANNRFEVAVAEEGVIRKESGQPVKGGIYILRAAD